MQLGRDCCFSDLSLCGRYKFLQKSSFHGCWLTILVVWRSLWVQFIAVSMTARWRGRHFAVVTTLGHVLFRSAPSSFWHVKVECSVLFVYLTVFFASFRHGQNSLQMMASSQEGKQHTIPTGINILFQDLTQEISTHTHT